MEFVPNSESTVYAEVTRQLEILFNDSIPLGPSAGILVPGRRPGKGKKGTLGKGGMRPQVILSTLCQNIHWPSLSLRRGSVVNFFRGISCLTLKHQMPTTLSFTWPSSSACSPPSSAHQSHHDHHDHNHDHHDTQALFLPETHVFFSRSGMVDPPEDGWKDAPARAAVALALGTTTTTTDNNNNKSARRRAFIAKSSVGAKASGILVSTDPGEIEARVDADTAGRAWVVQEYIRSPMLVQGRKFDVRSWVLVDHTCRAFLHGESVMRTCSRPYDPQDLADIVSNITNHCVQEELAGDLFGAHEPGNERFLSTFDATGEMRAQIAKASAAVVAAAREFISPQPEGSQPYRSFQLLGLDFLFTEDGRAVLLEVNGAPAAAEGLRESVATGIIKIAIAGALGDPVQVAVGESVPGTAYTRIL